MSKIFLESEMVKELCEKMGLEVKEKDDTKEKRGMKDGRKRNQ